MSTWTTWTIQPAKGAGWDTLSCRMGTQRIQEKLNVRALIFANNIYRDHRPEPVLNLDLGALTGQPLIARVRERSQHPAQRHAFQPLDVSSAEYFCRYAATSASSSSCLARRSPHRWVVTSRSRRACAPVARRSSISSDALDMPRLDHVLTRPASKRRRAERPPALPLPCDRSAIRVSSGPRPPIAPCRRT